MLCPSLDTNIGGCLIPRSSDSSESSRARKIVLFIASFIIATSMMTRTMKLSHTLGQMPLVIGRFARNFVSQVDIISL